MTSRLFRGGRAFTFFLAVCFCWAVRADAPAEAPPQPINLSQGESSHKFVYVPESGEKPEHVFVAGDFNGWSTDANELHKGRRSFEATVAMAEGVHHYKFIVDGKWITDPRADKELEIDDTYGGRNSGVHVGEDAEHAKPLQPGVINAGAVSFSPQEVKDCNVASATELRLSLAAQKGNLTGASVMMQPSDAAAWQNAEMWKMETGPASDHFGTLLTINSPAVRYIFVLHDGESALYVGNGKAYASASSAEADPYVVEMTPKFETPDWAKHVIWYQIFPERFRNGDTSNDPKNTKKWTSSWFELQPGEKGNFYRNIFDRRYGGDIQGVMQELPYLRKLGISAIYLNPIFQAESLHKYDATDYRHVDEHFGFAGDIEQLHGETDDPATWQWTKSDKLFLDFVAEAHRQGFKVIVDGVFNHVGRPFWAFQDIVKNGKDSKYADWFDIIDWNPGKDKDGHEIPFHYRAWDGDNGSLPAFKKDPVLGIVHGPREHILAIARRWLAPDGDPSRGVDGFRLDAPENVPHPFWVDFRKTVKQAKPDAYIDGEIWSWAQAWLSGDQFDAVMNYQFAIPTQQYFVDQKTAIDTSEYNRRMNAVVFNYPFQVALDNQNLLDSHDTDRAASMFMNPDLGFNNKARLQDTNSKYDARKPNPTERQKMLQEVAMQMTFVGAPMVYYGDEVGMWGPGDPSDRMPMIWKDLGKYDDPEMTFDQGKFDWYQRLIALRRQMPALQTGFFHPVAIDDSHSIYGFARTLGNQQVYVFINRSATGQAVDVKLPQDDASSPLFNWLDAAQARMSETGDAADSRPMVALKADATPVAVHDGMLHVELQPWGAAVLAAGK